MPDNDDLLAGLEVDDLVDGLTAEPEGATPQAAADYAATVRKGTEQTPYADKPWYDQLGQNLGDSPAAAPLRSLAENAGNTFLGSGGDELQALGTSIPTDHVLGSESSYQSPYVSDEPKREYAAGSQFEDHRQTHEAERLERDDENPVSSTVGQVGGAVAQGAMLPAAAMSTVPRALGSSGALTGAQMLGEQSGDLGERAEGAYETAKESPYLTAAALAAPAAGAKTAQGARAVQSGLENRAAANTVASFTTPSERAAIAEGSKLGQDAVVKLGKDVREMGLHEQPWYKFFLPPNAETFYTNARGARQSANEAMSTAEDAIVRAGDPAIDTASIADDLEQSASKVEGMWDKSAAAPEANFRREQAQGLRRPQEVPSEDGLEILLQQETAPFSEALQNRRYYDKNIDFDRRGGYEGAGMKEQVRRQVASQLRGKLDEGLEGAVSRGEIPEQPVRDWQSAKKQYSTAAAVEDPALARMQGEYGGSMGLKDLAGAGLFSSMGAPAALSAGSAKMMQGRWPGFVANQQARGARVAGRTAATAEPAGHAVREAATPSPIEQAQAENPGAPVAVVEAKANESVKEKLLSSIAEAAQEGKDWFSSLVD